MLDISFIRQNEDIVKMAGERRGVGEAVKKSLAKLVKLDDERKVFTKDQHDSPEYADCIKNWRAVMLEIPNIPDISAPNETVEVEKVGESKKGVETAKLWYERDAVRVYTDVGTKLLESVASVRESFFTNKGYAARVVLRGGADISHQLLLERPLPTTKLLALGAEHVPASKSSAEEYCSSVARGVHSIAGSHMVSVEVFETIRAEVEELCELLRITYTLELVDVKDMPASACKMYRLLLNTADITERHVLAEWYYEHDYSARRYGCMYVDEAGAKRRFAHTVRLNLGEAHVWLIAAVTSNTRDGVCMLPQPLQARFTEPTIAL
jgi:seryl-tRNA synthetase